MPAPTHVRLRHPDGREWDCPTRAVPHWEAKGWKKAAAAKKATKKTAKKTSSRPKKRTTAKKATSNSSTGD